MLTVALAAALVLGVAAVGLAAMASMTPGAVAVDVNQVTVKVVGVNHAARTLTLQMPNGKTMAYKVGKDVMAFNQIKKGDLIKVSVLDSLALFIQKRGGRPAATETQAVMLAPRGRPGMIAVNTYQVSAKIQLVDPANRTVTITMPNYESRMMKVGPDVKNLKSLKPGDDVVVRYTEAIAIDLQKPRT
jgi:hypothetical protein